MTPDQEAKQKALMAGMDFSILDGTLDDIDDLPSFTPFPSGAYHVVLSEGLQRKPIGTHPGVECKMKLIEVKELSNPVQDEAIKPKVGDECTSVFMLDNPIGLGFLKSNVLQPIGDKLGIKSNGAIIEASKNIQAIVVLEKQVVTKDGSTKEYCKIIRFVPL
jgi:hypothetical protein